MNFENMSLSDLENAVNGLGMLDTNTTASLVGVAVKKSIDAMNSGSAAEKATGARLIKNISARQHKVSLDDKSSRAEFIRRMDILPKEIQVGIATKQLQLVDVTLFNTIVVSSATSGNVFTNDQTLVDGVRNIANAKLPSDFHVLCTGISTLCGQYADTVTASTNLTNECAATVFDSPFSASTFVAIDNGNFTARINSKPMLPENTPVSWFKNKNTAVEKPGYKKLDNPKWIEAEKPISFEYKFPGAAPVRTLLRVELHGTAVMPY